jgi:hypothetical protein
VLAHAHRDQRQLGHLVPPRIHRVNQPRLGEGLRARTAPLGPMVDDLVDLLERKQRPVAPLVSGLAAAHAAGARPALPSAVPKVDPGRAAATSCASCD